MKGKKGVISKYPGFIRGRSLSIVSILFFKNESSISISMSGFSQDHPRPSWPSWPPHETWSASLRYCVFIQPIA